MKLILPLIVVTLLSGCAALDVAKVTAKTTADVLYLDQIIESGAPATIIKSANLSDKEIAQINEAIHFHQFFRASYLEYLRDPASSIVELSQFKQHYNTLVYHSLTLNKIVGNNAEDYDDEQIDIMQTWWTKMLSVHLEVSALIKAGEKHSAIVRAIDFGQAMIGILLK